MSVYKEKKSGEWTGKWMYHFWFQGEQYTKKGYKTKKDAEEAEAERKKELKNPPLELTPSISFAALATQYLQDCKARMQTNTWRAKAKYYADFVAWNKGDIEADKVTVFMLNQYLLYIHDQHGAKRANRDMKDIKAMYNWAILQEELGVSKNPAKPIQEFPEDPADKYVPPPEDIEKVLMAANQEEMDLLICLYHTGGRISEIRRLTWEDVNFEKRSVTLWTRKRRGGQLEADKLAMSEKLYQVLTRRWRDRNKESAYVFCREDGTCHTKDGKLRHLMEDLCARAKVKPFGFHAIRHHVASIIADSGKATLGQIQKFLRHRRQSTTEKYLHELTRDQREVAELLDIDLSARIQVTDSDTGSQSG